MQQYRSNIYIFNRFHILVVMETSKESKYGIHVNTTLCTYIFFLTVIKWDGVKKDEMYERHFSC